MQDGYPIIAQTVAGGPADTSGQLHQGDRIVGLAVDNGFVDARSLNLNQIVQMVRGAPGTTLQLQVVPADAPPDSAPRTISITRDQVKFKR
jgi:carboxyl-terminal processing protease